MAKGLYTYRKLSGGNINWTATDSDETRVVDSQVILKIHEVRHGELNDGIGADIVVSGFNLNTKPPPAAVQFTKMQ